MVSYDKLQVALVCITVDEAVNSVSQPYVGRVSPICRLCLITENKL